MSQAAFAMARNQAFLHGYLDTEASHLIGSSETRTKYYVLSRCVTMQRHAQAGSGK
jgi:hypothetical protein